MYIYIKIYRGISAASVDETKSFMRHTARTSPFPGFVVCGLLRLTSFQKLQNATQRFEVSVSCYLFSKSYLPDGAAECKNDASIISKIMSIEAWRIRKCDRGHLGRLLGSQSASGTQPGAERHTILIIMLPLVDFVCFF